MRCLLGLLALLVASASYADFAVVVGKHSPIGTLDRREVANIFLDKTTHLSDGYRVRPIELDNNNYQAHFYQDIAGKTLPEINSYWTTLIFTGKGRPPQKVDKINQLIKQLNEDPASISYLPSDLVTGAVRVLHVLH